MCHAPLFQEQLEQLALAVQGRLVPRPHRGHKAVKGLLEQGLGLPALAAPTRNQQPSAPTPLISRPQRPGSTETRAPI
eukprot:COSAG05_NODE_2047_length_3643_cov_3.595655_3_plen_78_part_00